MDVLNSGGFPNLGVPFRGSYEKDYSIGVHEAQTGPIFITSTYEVPY